MPQTASPQQTVSKRRDRRLEVRNPIAVEEHLPAAPVQVVSCGTEATAGLLDLRNFAVDAQSEQHRGPDTHDEEGIF
jgi:hypothetical protein